MLGRNLAGQAGIPSDYLYKILLNLKNAGILDASRGIGGGYRLKKRAEKIRLYDVVSIFEGITSDPSCLLNEKKRCSNEHPCSAHHAWGDVRQAYLQFLRNSTVADITRRSENGESTQKRRISRQKNKP